MFLLNIDPSWEREWERLLKYIMFLSKVNNVGMNYTGILANFLDVSDPEKVWHFPILLL